MMTPKAVLKIFSVYLLFASGILLPLGSVAAQNSDLGDGGYVLGVGDVITVTVWRNPELTSQVQVRPDGRISLPLIGDVEVAGRQPMEVEGLMQERFSDYVKTPEVSIVVNEINSLKIYIIGEVISSGVYDILSPTTLLQALAMAGGFGEYAKKDELVVLRAAESPWKRKVVNVKLVISGKRPDDNIVLLPGDTVIVP